MEFREDQAIYLQIADYICENILIREWQKDQKIPSVREMAIEIEVNPNTVMRAYAYLQELGIIYNRRGIGYFVAPDAFRKTKSIKKEEFTSRELPKIFRQMELLNIEFDELKTYYKQMRGRHEND